MFENIFSYLSTLSNKNADISEVMNGIDRSFVFATAWWKYASV